MNKGKRHERKVKVAGISEKAACERFVHTFLKDFKGERMPDKGQYVVYHGRIHLGDNSVLDVIIYTTDVMFLSATPSLLAEAFGRLANDIVTLAQQCTTKLMQVRPLTLQRAASILEFASGLKPENEFERMVIVILADTSNEIVVTELMKASKIKGTPLDAGIPDKIETLKQKGVHVFRESDISNTRELRNGIVHDGNIPDRNQAIQALKLALDILEKA